MPDLICLSWVINMCKIFIKHIKYTFVTYVISIQYSFYQPRLARCPVDP